MKNIFNLLIFTLLITAFACESNADSTTETEEETTETTEEAPQEEAVQTGDVIMNGDNYSITMMEAGIKSPRKEMKAQIGDATVTINYGSPSVRGRTIFGGLEDFDVLWRTGANKATSIEFSQDVMIGDQKVAAGKYGLFTIPGKEDWTVVINQDHEQWGAGSYTEDKDVARITVSPRMLDELKEEMDFVMAGDAIELQWENTAVPFTVQPAS
ncbi:MAG: DUF2911 domain-containing protein [Bacteroidota bacterium]